MGFIEATVYDRYALAPGTTILGPAVVEEKEDTAVLRRDRSEGSDEFYNIVRERESRTQALSGSEGIVQTLVNAAARSRRI